MTIDGSAGEPNIIGHALSSCSDYGQSGNSSEVASGLQPLSYFSPFLRLYITNAEFLMLALSVNHIVGNFPSML